MGCYSFQISAHHKPLIIVQNSSGERSKTQESVILGSHDQDLSLVHPLSANNLRREGIDISCLFDDLFCGLACAVASPHLHPGKEWVLLTAALLSGSTVLQRGQQLVGVQRNHAIIMIPCGNRI